MNATYNWAYRPGISNKYGITINAGADNLRPSNAAYVAMSGNDINGNGSRELPYKTINKAKSILTSGQFIIVASGVYRENLDFSSGSVSLVGDGYVIADQTLLITAGTTNGIGAWYNIIFRNVGQWGSALTTYYLRTMYDCTLSGDGIVAIDNALNQKTGNVISNLGSLTFVDAGAINNINLGYNTFVNIGTLKINIPSATVQSSLSNSIYYNCKIDIMTAPNIDFCVLYDCKARIGASGPYTTINNIDQLVNLIQTAYPLNPSFKNSVVANPLFNNISIGDYSLTFDSPAKNRSYIGTFVGAKSIGQSIKVKSIEAEGDIEFDSAINITFNNDSLRLTDLGLTGQFDSKIIINALGREISKFPCYGFNADRNGQYLDSTPDLSNVTYAAGDTLPSSMPFIVETGAIVYNGATYLIGERGTTVTAATSFTSAANGVMKKIIESPQRQTIMARFSDGGASIFSGETLIPGYYYFVSSGSVTYNNITYDQGATFKALNTDSFSGSGFVNIAFSTETYQHYEVGCKPTSNNVGDNRTGLIIRGNGDPLYNRGGLGLKEFPINAKFIQIRYVIQVNNLRP